MPFGRWYLDKFLCQAIFVLCILPDLHFIPRHNITTSLVHLIKTVSGFVSWRPRRDTMRVTLHDHQLGEEEEDLRWFNAIILVTTTAHHVVFVLPLLGDSL